MRMGDYKRLIKGERRPAARPQRGERATRFTEIMRRVRAKEDGPHLQRILPVHLLHPTRRLRHRRRPPETTRVLSGRSEVGVLEHLETVIGQKAESRPTARAQRGERAKRSQKELEG